MINWFEIPAEDIERAAEFYSKIFLLALKVLDFGVEKMAFFPDGYNISGAISQAKGFKPSKEGISITFYAGENMTEMLKRISNNGGKIQIQKTKIEAEDKGYFATFIDSEGNSVGIYSEK